jgi:tetratricopeptide (TPR) repeat protein
LLGDVHLLLAELGPIVSNTATDTTHVARARRVAPGNAELLVECGLVEYQLGRNEQAVSDWKQAAEADPKLFPKLVRLVMSDETLLDHVEPFLPEDPRLLIKTAAGLSSDTQAAGQMREQLLAKAERSVTAGALPDDEQHYLLARICLLRDAPSEAIEHFWLAVELRPTDHAWRFELASQLKADQRYDEATKQIAVCRQLAPGHPRYEKFLKDLIQAQLNPTRTRVSRSEG